MLIFSPAIISSGVLIFLFKYYAFSLSFSPKLIYIKNVGYSNNENRINQKDSSDPRTAR